MVVNVWKTSPFVGPLIPLIGLLVMFTLGFKAMVYLLTCMLDHLNATKYSDLPLMQYFLTSWRPTRQMSHLNPCTVPAYKDWWGSSWGSTMPLPHSMWQDKYSTGSIECKISICKCLISKWFQALELLKRNFMIAINATKDNLLKTKNFVMTI